MSRIVLLDSGPLGLVTGPRSKPLKAACQQWLADLLSAGVIVHVPEIADYEVRLARLVPAEEWYKITA